MEPNDYEKLQDLTERFFYPIGSLNMSSLDDTNVSINFQRKQAGLTSAFEDFVKRYELVDYNYLMVPDEEDVIFAKDLEEGMIVLSQDNKQALHCSSTETDLVPTLRENRWCTVTNLNAVGSNRVAFVGLYQDGTKFARHSAPDDGWIVKKSSMQQRLHCMDSSLGPMCAGEVEQRTYTGLDDLTIQTDLCLGHYNRRLRTLRLGEFGQFGETRKD